MKPRPSKVNKAILAEIVRQYIEREARLVSAMNKIYRIMWGQCNPGIQSVLKRNEYFTFNFKKRLAMSLIQETRKITSGLDVKLNNPAILYNFIRIFINLQQEENEPNDTFRLRWDNVCETMEKSY